MAELGNNNSNRGLDLGCSPKVTLIAAALLILGVLAIFLLTREPSVAEIARSRLQIERAEAWQPWTVALGIAWRVVAIGVGLVLLLGLVAAMRVLVRWLDTRSRLIRPDPHGKGMTGVVGGKVGLLLVLLLRHVLGREVSELTEQPAILITPPDTSAAQLQVTGQAQAVQALAAASRGTTAQQAVQAAQAMLPMRQADRGLPPLLVEGTQPREVQLLLEAGRRQWTQDKGDEVVDVSP